ncbi:MAG: type VI secretion system contractile sheath large subunit [Ectothiorhodospiraceae bacterium]|nr:type VI secretion system contractile sheath large subunit [Ectothiorhodospiraceae bacterium]
MATATDKDQRMEAAPTSNVPRETTVKQTRRKRSGGHGRRPAVTRRSTEQARASVERLLVHLDRVIGRQLDEILHHPRFQKLEASWRGVDMLVNAEADYDELLAVKVRVLNVSWQELGRDLTRALEFDQSQIFRRIYSDEFGTPGGEPFGVLLGDYAVSHRPRRGIAASDIQVLREMARIATAALCPFITNADGTLFGMDSFRELAQPAGLDALFRQREYASWRRLREDEHTRFLGLTLPRILMREPYRDDGTRLDGFRYREGVTTSTDHYLWGNACYAFGTVLIRAFGNTGWFADIRGGEHSFGEGGMVGDMIYSHLDQDRLGHAPRTAAELQIEDHTERELSEFGFIPLCSHHGKRTSVFYSNSSVHEPPCYGSELATLNARLSAMIQYMLCVSRFGHYIKVMGRDRIGSFVNADDCQKLFQDWLNRYTTSNSGASAELKARYPLAASRVEVREQAGRPGHFTCVIHMQPHFQLDQLVSSIRLVTELAIGPTGTGQ